MATLRDTVIPLNDYPTGVYELPLRVVPDSTQYLWFEFARCTDADPTIWPHVETTVRAVFEVSTDDVTWVRAGSFAGEGGIREVKGEQLAISAYQVGLPPVSGRKLRATVTIADPVGRPLRTSGSMELRDEVHPLSAAMLAAATLQVRS